jgi:hypothetical protein
MFKPGRTSSQNHMFSGRGVYLAVFSGWGFYLAVFSGWGFYLAVFSGWGFYLAVFSGRGFYLAVGGGSAQHTKSYIQDILQDKKWDCRLIDHSEDMALLSVQGPNRYSILT